MKKKGQKILLIILLITALIAGLVYLMSHIFPNQEAIQEFFESLAWFGYVFYFLFGTTAVVIVPINFSITGAAGGFVYGVWVAFFINWACKIVGNMIAFMAGRLYGEKVLKLFSKKKREKYRHMARSEKAFMLYFILSFLPFTPSDAFPYFLGCSEMKVRQFVPICTLATTGTAFSLAYVGSGEALDSPLFFLVLVLIILGGVTWMHKHKKALHLE